MANTVTTITGNLAQANVAMTRAEATASELISTLTGEGETNEPDKATTGVLQTTRALADRLERLVSQLQRMRAALIVDPVRAGDVAGALGQLARQNALSQGLMEGQLNTPNPDLKRYAGRDGF